MNYLVKLSKLEKKHGRHFPDLSQAMKYDVSNPSYREIVKQNKKARKWALKKNL